MRLKTARAAAVLALILAACSGPVAARPPAAKAPPQRLLALAPSAFEQLCALGLQGRVVGVTSFCDWPPAAAEKMPSVGSYVNPSLEAALALRPDLALAAFGTRRAALDRLRSEGVEVRLCDPRTVEEAVASLSEVARWCGEPRAGEGLAQRLRARLEAVRGAVAGAPRPRVFLQLGCGSLFSAASGSLQGDLVHEAGGFNVAAAVRGPYPRLSLEQVLALAPEVILVVTDDAAGFEGEKKNWLAQPVPAARARRIFALPVDPVQRPGPRLLSGLERVAALLHPERFISERFAAPGGGR